MNSEIKNKLAINEIKNLTKLISEIDIKDISDESTFAGKKYDLPSNKYFILHHTAGRGDAHRIVKILNNRFKGGLGVQYVIDREGNIYRTLPLGARGAHILNSRLGPNNSNSQGVEVIGNNDSDILPVQAVAALQLVKHLGFKPSQLYGHGEVNPGHRSPSEGMTIKKFITANYNETDPEEYDFSMFQGRDSEIEAAKQMKNFSVKDKSKLDMFLDKIGLGKLFSAKSGDKESQKDIVDKVKQTFSDKDVVEKDDNFEIFGFDLGDVLGKVSDFIPTFESEEKSKKLVEEIKKFKSIIKQ